MLEYCFWAVEVQVAVPVVVGSVAVAGPEEDILVAEVAPAADNPVVAVPVADNLGVVADSLAVVDGTLVVAAGSLAADLEEDTLVVVHNPV